MLHHCLMLLGKRTIMEKVKGQFARCMEQRTLGRDEHELPIRIVQHIHNGQHNLLTIEMWSNGFLVLGIHRVIPHLMAFQRRLPGMKRRRGAVMRRKRGKRKRAGRCG